MSLEEAENISNYGHLQAIGTQHTLAHVVSGLNRKSGKQVANRLRVTAGKNDSRYWLSRLFHPINDRDEVSPHYSMKVQFRGRRMAFTLGTANKEAAARKAAALYANLITLGVEATLVKYRAQKPRHGVTGATIGDWIAVAGKVFDGKPATFGGYARSLRLIASAILAISKSKKRYGRLQARAYRQQVDVVPLTILTPEAIQAWRIHTVKQAGENPALQRSARVSCNSTIRQARSLFSGRIMKFINGVSVPNPLPFAGVEFYPRESMKYKSKLNPVVLLQSAEKHLSGPDPEAFKTLFLALGAGLRRGEIDRLLWRQVDFAGGVIHVETTEAGGLKSEESAGDVPIDSTLVSLLRGFRAKASGQFVIEEGTGITASKPWGQRYRCEGVFYRLTQWLRNNGVEGSKPLHTLRKEAGSIIATKAGIYAASRFLRHADIQVTAMHYADHKQRVTVDMGALLAPQNVTEMKPEATAVPAPKTRTKRA